MLTQRVMVINCLLSSRCYFCLTLFSMVLTDTICTFFVTPNIIHLYGRPCHIPSYSLSKLFPAQPAFSCDFLKSFYQSVIGTLPHLVFIGTHFVPLATSLTFHGVIQFVAKNSSKYPPHKRQACYWP